MENTTQDVSTQPLENYQLFSTAKRKSNRSIH